MKLVKDHNIGDKHDWKPGDIIGFDIGTGICGPYIALKEHNESPGIDVFVFTFSDKFARFSGVTWVTYNGLFKFRVVKE